MKAVIELPEMLANELSQRAREQGREVGEVMVELLSASVSAADKPTKEAGLVVKTLPLIKVRPVQPPADRKLAPQEMCDWIKEVDLQLEVERYEKALGHQHVDRADG